MSKFLDRFRYFKQRGETFSGDHGQELNVNRDWEDGYRSRWQHDKSCPFHPRRELYRFMQLENLREKRAGDLGDAAD